MAENETVWMYDPSIALAIIGSVVYGIIFLAITYLTCIKYRAWYFTPAVVGAAIEVGGYICRSYSVKNQSEIVSYPINPLRRHSMPDFTPSKAPMAVSLTLIVLGPVFIAAANYMLISRLILAVLPPSRHRVLRIPGRRLTTIFVTCDIVAFLIQGSGSGIASSNDWAGEEERIGRYVLIGGLSFQFLAFSFFLTVFFRFHFLGNRYEAETAPKNWRKLVVAVYVSSILIMVGEPQSTAPRRVTCANCSTQVRCVYRVAEFAEGMDGYAFRNEWLFWVFEALVMAPAIAIFCFYHPSRYLGKHASWKLQQSPSMSETSMVVGPRGLV